MSISLTLYTNSSDRKRINKQLGGALASGLPCTLKEDTSIINPTILISRSVLGSNISQANYAYIPEFGRYYFIDKPVVTTGQMVALEMTVDVLRTYKGGLYGNKFEIARAESLGNDAKITGYFVDTEKALQNRKTAYYRILGHITQSATGNKYTITVAGG